jgi:hypothetical protein
MNDCLSADQLPKIDGRYWVQCENFRCMAVFDKDGKWKSFSNGKELPDVINFCATQ